jgi:succinate-semialdehyde dehydrogenase/glutarate-semialdehyde dehydrogenase
VGRIIRKATAGTAKKLSLELGGKSPFIVFDDADLDAAVEGAIASKFRNTGQTCVCANRFLVQRGVFEEFAQRLAKRVSALVVGDGLEGVTHQGPLINDAALDKVERHVQDATNLGGEVLTGGQRIGGCFYQPTVIKNATPAMALFREETFGPVAGLVRFEHEREAIEMANDTSAGLAAYLYTRDVNRSWRVAEALDYGMVGHNTGLISTTVAPFGGVKESGLGREGSYYGIQDYLDTKLMCSEIAPE